MTRLTRFLMRSWLEFKHRNQDPDVCCCGSYVGKGGDICRHGGCRSMKEYTIDVRLGKTT